MPKARRAASFGRRKNGAMPLCTTASFPWMNGNQEICSRVFLETQIVLCERAMVSQTNFIIRIFCHHGLGALNSQPWEVKIIFFTPASRAAKLPSPPILELFVWNTAGLSFL